MTKIKEISLEAKRDFSIIRKQFVFLTAILTIATLLIAYNIKFLELEREITSLKKSKEFLVYEQIKLKQQVASLKDPKRINKIAVRKLHMKPVDMEKVKFIKR